MLRTHDSEETPATSLADPTLEFPGEAEPFATGERSIGVLFYQLKQGFYLPYISLQSMAYTADRLALEFPEETIVITGRGLHALYVGLARQTVSRVVQQGDHPSQLPTHVVRIRRVPRPARGRSAPGPVEPESGDGLNDPA